MLSKINEITGNAVTVQFHRTLNAVRDTVCSEAIIDSTEEAKLEELECQEVGKVESIKKKIINLFNTLIHAYF